MDKVGIICHSMEGHNNGKYQVTLYLINLDSESSTYTRVAPAVRFLFPKRETILAVCVLNSTVYIFGGRDNFGSYNPDMFRQNYAVKFVLTDKVLSKGNYKVGPYDLKNKVSKISVMNHDKDHPVAIPTPDGTKILVFGTIIGVGASCRAFELYDIVLDTWEELPGLPCRDEGGFRVRCYSFVDECRFFVVTDKGSCFVLDFKDKVWESVVDALDVYGTSGYFVTAKGRYVLTSAGMVYDFGSNIGGILSIGKDFNSGPLFPLSSFAPPNAPASLQKVAIPSIVPLRPILQAEEGDVCNTCILRLEMLGCTRGGAHGWLRGAARLLIDVCHTELPTLNTSVSNSVSLHIDFLEFLKGVTLISV